MFNLKERSKQVRKNLKSVKHGFGKSEYLSYEKNIQKALNSSLPDDFIEFYKQTSYLDYSFGDYKSHVSSIFEMFDGSFSPIPELTEKDIKTAKYKKDPMYNVLLTDWQYENMDFENETKLNDINRIRRQKVLISFQFSNDFVTVDFFETPYQLNYYDGSELFKIQLDLTQFIEKFLYLGETNFWFWHFLSEQEQKNISVQIPSWDEIEAEIKGFKRAWVL